MPRSKVENKLKIICILFVFLCSCQKHNIKQTLKHPAITLIKADKSLSLMEPSLSPDGLQLAVIGINVCGFGNCNVDAYILNMKTSELVPFLAGYSILSPSWTPDPEMVSFYWYGKGDQHQGIYKANIGDNKLEFVSDGNLVAWSPDGNFVSIGHGKGPGTNEDYIRPWVSVLNLVNNREIRVFKVPHTNDETLTGLAWSQNDDVLALSATWWTHGTGNVAKIYIVNADGTDLREIADGGHPGWMPDGKWLFFLGKDSKLTFTPLDGSCLITPLDIEHIKAPFISFKEEKIVFEHDGNIYMLDYKKILGENLEKLVCEE